MKTITHISIVITVIFLFAVCGCNINQKPVAKSGLMNRGFMNQDSNFTNEQINNDDAINDAGGKSVSNSEYNNINSANFTGDPNSENSNYGVENIINDYSDANNDIANIDTFENSLTENTISENIFHINPLFNSPQ
jgi:hypothetical protein